jgi:hypothetical protein
MTPELKAVKHQAVIKSPAQTLHHESVFQLKNHSNFTGCKLSIFLVEIIIE